MIPLKLQVKNFLSYGSEIQTIEFGAYPLICLSGKNGHGKSALLDAITWAVWGQARKLSGIAKADQGLLRLGQTQMMVCLDFECAGQRYRIKREYMQTYGKPIAALEFGLLDQSHDRFIPLTDKTIRDTQHKIEQTLHLTYDGFINSAFLRQGQANEFSKKSPKERKEVLGAILGLDQYENIRRLAAERIKQATTYKQHLHTLNTKLEQELASVPTIVQKLAEIELKQKEIYASEQKAAHTKRILEKNLLTFQHKKQENAMLFYQHEQLQKDRLQNIEKLHALRGSWREIHRQQLKNIDFSQLESQKKILVDEIKQHQQALQEQLQSKQELLSHKENFARLSHELFEKKSAEINVKKIAIERLLAEENHLKNSCKELQATQARTYELQLATEKELSLLIAQQSDRAKNLMTNGAEKQFERRKEYYQRWIAQANMISAELSALEKKNRLVHDENSPSCPLCEQNLTASRKRFLKNKFEEDINFLKHRLGRLSNTIKKLKTLLIEQHAALEKIAHEKNQLQLLAIKIEELGKTRANLEVQLSDCASNLQKHQELESIVRNTLEKERAFLAELEQKSKQDLLQNPELQKIAGAIKKLEDALAAHSYNQEIHERAMRVLADIEQLLKLHSNLHEQQILQAQRQEQISQICKQLKTNKTQLTKIQSLVCDETILENEEKALQQRMHFLENEINEIAKTKEELIRENGSLQNQKEKLDQIHQEYCQQQKELATCCATIDDYQAISQATGKDGIQALLIEDAIPEIESEANELLSKLTENQTQLFIESLRDLKKGGTKETLDIKISDAAGIRPYELFSGGEAFRIDFALRIAISKLLARRSGTSLQTLIIDEGFGSQDEEGLSHIMDALYKIQDDFAKIIIVSHLNSMKNQFPVHFVIEKGPNGSIVHVMEQG